MSKTIWPAPGAPAAPIEDTFSTATAPKPIVQSQGRGAAAPVPLEWTDPATIGRAAGVAMNNVQFGQEVEAIMMAKMREYGMDSKIDRQHLAIPETDTGGRLDLQHRILGNGGRVFANPVRECMDQWFRFVLFGREIKHDIVKRAMSVGSDPAGGYIVPPGFIPEIITDAAKLGGLYQYCRRIPVGTTSGEIPNLLTDVAVTWGSENVAMTENQPVLSRKTWAVNRMNVITKQSRELVNDSNPNSVDYVTDLFRRKVVEERDRVVVKGTGSGQPLGLASATGLIEVDAPTEVDYEFLVAMHESVDERYFASPGMRWSFSQAMKQRVMTVRDDEGRPLVHMDPTQGFRLTLFGHPITVETFWNSSSMFFGDLQFYLVFDRETLGVERSTEAGDATGGAFSAHQLWIKFFERWDGLPVVNIPTVPMAICKTIPAHSDSVN